MTDNDYNTVRPIEGPQNVLGVAPAEQRQHQRRKATQDNRQEPRKDRDDQSGEETPKNDRDDSHSIDYRA